MFTGGTIGFDSSPYIGRIIAQQKNIVILCVRILGGPSREIHNDFLGYG